MYNSEHKGHCSPMSPRISFSNDFAESQYMMKQERSTREAPVSSDFEFSVTNDSMMSADELFFKGKLLPFKDNCNNQMHRTLREELRAEEDDDSQVSLKPPKGYSTRWKGFLGLRRTHIGSKKAEKSDGAIGKADESKKSIFAHEDAHVTTNTSKELPNEGGSSSRDFDIRI
ncbi:uncharacterized protein LOC123207124 [Mangifera indica]|uniref:uncharacterized protein LOC123199484 n=1 Tax=Mangifera indica TaxID=29780 RepID=UPI001CFAA1C4|nr:uncharacterized protein LOC123199484 [Mangifera indica]XP_044480323.1 uncharacterized protein LOC123207124 [Mangifera indica]